MVGGEVGQLLRSETRLSQFQVPMFLCVSLLDQGSRREVAFEYTIAPTENNNV